MRHFILKIILVFFGCMPVVSIATTYDGQHYFITFPPYWAVSESGERGGYHYNLALRLYAEVGLKIEMISIPTGRLRAPIHSNKVLFANYGMQSGENPDDVVYKCTPPTSLAFIAYTLYVPAGKLNSIEALLKHHLIAVNGLPLGNYEPLKHHKEAVISMPQDEQAAVKMLFSGRGEMLIGYRNIDIEISRYPKEEQARIKRTYISNTIGYPIVTPKTYAGGPEKCERVRTAYWKLKKSGVIHPDFDILVEDIER